MSLVLKRIEKSVAGLPNIYTTDLEIADGLTVFLGHTQAGKTSLMRLIAGLDQPSGGKILFRGEDITGLPLQKRKVAMVYQQFINYPSFTVYDNIASPLKLAGLSKSEIDQKVRETAELLHLETFLQRYPGELSGGQQQRTAIARALVKDANILLFDEPLANLDYKLREELRQEIRGLFDERRTVAIYATTEPGEALLLGGNTVVIDRGRVVQSGPSLEVYRRPADIRSAQVFSDPQINTAHGRVEGGRIHLGPELSCPLPLSLKKGELPDGDYRFAIRAGHLNLRRQNERDIAVDAQVDFSEVSGSETFVHVCHGDLRWIVHQTGVHSYRFGDEATVFFDPELLFVFNADGRLRCAPAGKESFPVL